MEGKRECKVNSVNWLNIFVIFMQIRRKLGADMALCNDRNKNGTVSWLVFLLFFGHSFMIVLSDNAVGSFIVLNMVLYNVKSS